MVENIDQIINSYKAGFLEPLLGNGEVAHKLEAGLYGILCGEYHENVLSVTIREAFKEYPRSGCYVRATNVFYHMGAKTLGDVTRLTEAELLNQRNIGIKTVRYIRKELRRYGLDIRNPRNL